MEMSLGAEDAGADTQPTVQPEDSAAESIKESPPDGCGLPEIR